MRALSRRAAVVAVGDRLELSDDSRERVGARLFAGQPRRATAIVGVSWHRIAPDSIEVRSERAGAWRRIALGMGDGGAEGTVYATNAALGAIVASRHDCQAAR